MANYVHAGTLEGLHVHRLYMYKYVNILIRGSAAVP